MKTINITLWPLVKKINLQLQIVISKQLQSILQLNKYID